MISMFHSKLQQQNFCIVNWLLWHKIRYGMSAHVHCSGNSCVMADIFL